MRRALLSLAALTCILGGLSCLRGWDLGGPWKCGDGDTCPGAFVCDDGVCCLNGGSPSCPTLPLPGGGCADGTPIVYFRDEDGDGDGNEKVSRVFCHAPLRKGWVTTGTDCDDVDPAINASASEQCNGKDDNCNRVVDEGLPNLRAFYPDEDGDGVGVEDAGVQACAAPPGYTATSEDCARYDPSKFPGAGEQCNNLDDDCDGVPDTLETTFVDSDTASTSRFPCLVPGAAGVCRAGTFRCQPTGDGGVVRVCRSVTTPSREVCDGLDNDCANGVDEGPDCGGPRTLIGAPGVVFRALRPSTTGTQMTSCQAFGPGTAETVSPDGKTWSAVSAMGQYYHVWSAEAPLGTTWDLSRLNAQLRLQFGATFAATSGPRGAWGNPVTGDAFNPVVYLCGASDLDFIRYRITDFTKAFSVNDMAFDQVLPLNNSSSTWLVGIGSGFDTSRVKRIEVLVFTLSSSFTITFDGTTTGMGP